MKQDKFEKYFKEIIMHASQQVVATGDTKIAGLKQTSIFTGKPVKEIAFMQMMEYLDAIKNLSLSDKDYSEEVWKAKLTGNIISSAILYALLFDEGVKESGESVDEENKK